MESFDNYNAIEAVVRRMFDPMGNRKLIIQPYVYPVAFTLAESAQGNATIDVAANANFVLTNPRFQASTGGEVVASPDITILLQDTGSQQNLMSNAVPIALYCGQPAFANDNGVLTYPRVIAGRSGIAITVQNRSASDDYTLDISFHGVQVYDLGAM